MRTISTKIRTSMPKPTMPKLPSFGLKSTIKIKGMINPLRMPK